MAEANNPLETIKLYWPDFPINQKIMQEPTSDLVISFYEQFILTINEKFECLKEGLTIRIPHYNLTDFDPVIELFLKVDYIYKYFNKYLGLGSVRLLDFYSPTAKRINSLFHVAIHFLVFLDHIGDETEALISMPLNKKLQQEKLEDLIVEMRHRINEKVTLVGKNKGGLESTSKKAEQMSQFEKLLGQDVNLLEHIIRDEDFYRLKALKEQLESEISSLSECDNQLIETLQIQKQSVEDLDEISKELKNLNYDESVSIITELQSETSLNKEIQTEKNHFIGTKNITAKEKEKLSRKYDESKLNLDEKSSKFESKKKEIQLELTKVTKLLETFQERKKQNESECEILKNKLKKVEIESAQVKSDSKILHDGFKIKFEEMKNIAEVSMNNFEEELIKIAEYKARSFVNSKK